MKTELLDWLYLPVLYSRQLFVCSWRGHKRGTDRDGFLHCVKCGTRVAASDG